jgi:sensor histidine kinase YesM
MKIIRPVNSLNTLLYLSIFMVTQVSGLLVSLAICYILKDFTWGFVRVALINSFLLGLALVGSCQLSQRLVFKFHPLAIMAISFALVLGISIISFGIVFFLEPAVFFYYSRGAIAFIVINFLFIIALHVIGSGLIIYREIMIAKEKAIGDERHLKKQMELRLLSSRVNPHFLFNTLNMILTLLKEPAKAEEAILNLSDLLRENLDQSEKTSIPVKQEIDNVRKYLELQKLRFGDKLHYEIVGDADFTIPPLIIQPLVENSIKHNMQKVAHLSIRVEFERDGSRGRISVTDSEKALRPAMLNQGQGLTITSRRVESSNGKFSIHNGGIEISFGI